MPLFLELTDKLTAELDPTGYFDPQNKEEAIALIGALGFIPDWLAMALNYPTIKAALIDNYPYYFGDMTGGNIDADGVYQYPEDPPLYPLIKMQLRDETFYQYEYGIVATVTDSGAQWVSRFD